MVSVLLQQFTEGEKAAILCMEVVMHLVDEDQRTVAIAISPVLIVVPEQGVGLLLGGGSAGGHQQGNDHRDQCAENRVVSHLGLAE